VSWKDAVNGALRKSGYELRRTGRRPTARKARPRATKLRAGDRLVEQPGFVMCTLRSGSTLLRVLLDSHSQIHCPHEIHLRHLGVDLESKWVERSMKEMGLDEERLEYLLWDRVLHRELTGSGKPRLVTKTPNDVFIADKIRECWPDAQFIFLLRHPAMIARSRAKLIEKDADPERNVDLIRRYCEALDHARRTYDGLEVRYEDLTRDPRAVTQRICEYLGVPWEESMLDYGSHDHGRFKSGLGDWADKIKTGQVQAPEPLPAPEDVPEPLRAVAAAWGYLPAAAPAA
jgi:LPS sulfotransferase NodH